MKKEKNKISPLKGSCLWGILLFAVLLLIDMVTKVAADEYFSRPDAPASLPVIPDWIELCITYNRGIAYGIGNDAPTWAKITVIAATGVLMAVLTVAYFVMDKRRTLVRVAIVFIVAGGLGNLIDRVYYRVWDPTTSYGVRDMVNLSRFGFAVCNFADFFITGGAVVLVLSMLFFDKDAIFPVGKYKQLAAEEKAAEEAKKAEENGKENG